MCANRIKLQITGRSPAVKRGGTLENLLIFSLFQCPLVVLKKLEHPPIQAMLYLYAAKKEFRESQEKGTVDLEHD